MTAHEPWRSILSAQYAARGSGISGTPFPSDEQRLSPEAIRIIYIDKYSRENDEVLLGILQIFWAGGLSCLFWVLFDFTWPAMNIHVMVAVGVTGLLATAFAYTMQTVVQKHTSPSRTALIFTMEPVFAFLFALLIPDSHGVRETATVHSVVGCLLIIGGMAVSELKPIDRRTRKKGA